ncbi:hypothetical protein [Massilia aquatica]|uniref:hypothetical protein n=1 Tax=Massilia aquatica TaxID=2609000 RepID=UPI001422C65F|nr:hypothetical protein [Massilia aquatica]
MRGFLSGAARGAVGEIARRVLQGKEQRAQTRAMLMPDQITMPSADAPMTPVSEQTCLARCLIVSKHSRQGGRIKAALEPLFKIVLRGLGDTLGHRRRQVAEALVQQGANHFAQGDDLTVSDAYRLAFRQAFRRGLSR